VNSFLLVKLLAVYDTVIQKTHLIIHPCDIALVDKIKELAKDYEFVVTNDPVKEAKNLAKKLKENGKKVIVEDLQDFGERAIRDVC